MPRLCSHTFHFTLALRKAVGELGRSADNKPENMRHHHFIKNLFFGTCILILFAVAPLKAAVVSMYWQGTITGITSFSQNSVPSGVAQGVPISGSLVFDSSQCTGTNDTLGDSSRGERYQYPDSLIQTFTIGQLVWRIQGAYVSLTDYSDYSGVGKTFDVFATSDNSNIELFPNYVGYIEAGFFIGDHNFPPTLFDSYDIGTIDLSQVTGGGGDLSTRLWDQPYGNIIDGYYVTFNINDISTTPVPEPSSFAFLLGVLCILLITRSGRHNRPNQAVQLTVSRAGCLQSTGFAWRSVTAAACAPAAPLLSRFSIHLKPPGDRS